MRFSALEQRGDNLVDLASRQPRSAPGSAGLEQAGLTLFRSGFDPTVDRLPVHAHPAGNFGLCMARFEQFESFKAALFQRIKVTFDTSRITHTPNLS